MIPDPMDQADQASINDEQIAQKEAIETSE